MTVTLPVSYTADSCDVGGEDCMSNIVGNVLSDTLTIMPSGGVVTYTLTGSMPDSRDSSTAIVMPPDGVLDVMMDNNIEVTWTLYKVICPVTARNATFQAGRGFTTKRRAIHIARRFAIPSPNAGP